MDASRSREADWPPEALEIERLAFAIRLVSLVVLVAVVLALAT